MNRRNFLVSTASVAVGATIAARSETKHLSSLRFGICADIHHDLIPDGQERLTKFIDTMLAEKPDFILQMGDFCQPEEQNQPFIDIWNKFPGPKHHVIGNHDLEKKRYTRERVLSFWGAKGAYYSFDQSGYHFVVLDGNEKNPDHPNWTDYDRYISDVQLDWLTKDLIATPFPAIIFCHQGLDANDYGIENAVAVRMMLEKENQRAGFQKVKIVFSGHHHQDYRNIINGISYIQINSMSYHYQRTTDYVDNGFSEDQKKQHPIYRNLALYSEPIWGLVSISSNGAVQVNGRYTTFRGRSPQEVGMPRYLYGYPVDSRVSSLRFSISECQTSMREV